MTSETYLYRQVYPNTEKMHFIQNGRLSSLVFKPRPVDEKQLSVFNGDLIDPRESFEKYNSNQQALGKSDSLSTGVVAVKVLDCENCSQPLEVHEDPQEALPEHALIDFNQCSTNQISKAAKYLRACSEGYFTSSDGWAYRP